MIRPATKKDLLCISDIYIKAFPDSINHIFPERPTKQGVQLVFRTVLRAEPQAFFVAEVQGRVVGYIFAPANIKRLWWAALYEFLTFRWLVLLLTGDLRISFCALRILLANKFSFISAARNQFQVRARILSLAVLPEFQGSGIGRKLVEEGLKYLFNRNVSKIRLEVRPENIPAVNLYEGLGFRIVSSTWDSQGEWLIMIHE